MSLTSRLHAWNGRQQRASDAHVNGWDPVTCDVVARRIEAAIEPCPGPVHEADCRRCSRNRCLRYAAQIARETGGLA